MSKKGSYGLNHTILPDTGFKNSLSASLWLEYSRTKSFIFNGDTNLRNAMSLNVSYSPLNGNEFAFSYKSLVNTNTYKESRSYTPPAYLSNPIFRSGIIRFNYKYLLFDKKIYKNSFGIVIENNPLGNSFLNLNKLNYEFFTTFNADFFQNSMKNPLKTIFNLSYRSDYSNKLVFLENFEDKKQAALERSVFEIKNSDEIPFLIAISTAFKNFTFFFESKTSLILNKVLKISEFPVILSPGVIFLSSLNNINYLFACEFTINTPSKDIYPKPVPYNFIFSVSYNFPILNDSPKTAFYTEKKEDKNVTKIETKVAEFTQLSVKGKILDEFTNKPLSGAEISVPEEAKRKKIITDKSGIFIIENILESEKILFLKIEKTNYMTYLKKVDLAAYDNEELIIRLDSKSFSSKKKASIEFQIMNNDNQPVPSEIEFKEPEGKQPLFFSGKEKNLIENFYPANYEIIINSEGFKSVFQKINLKENDFPLIEAKLEKCSVKPLILSLKGTNSPKITDNRLILQQKLQFDEEKNDLAASSKVMLLRAIKLIKLNLQRILLLKIEIQYKTNNVSKDEDSITAFKLSEIIANFLIHKGIPKEKIIFNFTLPNKRISEIKKEYLEITFFIQY